MPLAQHARDARREWGSLRAGCSIFKGDKSASDRNPTMDTNAGSQTSSPRVRGLEAMRRVAASNPSPSSPASFIRTSESCGNRTVTPACEFAAESTSAVVQSSATQLVGLVLGCSAIAAAFLCSGALGPECPASVRQWQLNTEGITVGFGQVPTHPARNRAARHPAAAESESGRR